MLSEELWRHYPILYHMAEAGSWPSIRQYGLLSTSALLDLFEVTNKQRESIESEWRKESVCITHPIHGKAIIRDQKPMPEKALQRCLRGLSPSEWYMFLNRKVFFWVREDRLVKLLCARAYKGRPHIVIHADTRALVRRHKDRITLSSINSGATFGGAGAKRGLDTFKRIEDFPFDEMTKKKHEDAVVELAVDYSVPDIMQMAFSVEEWVDGKCSRVVWRNKRP